MKRGKWTRMKLQQAPSPLHAARVAPEIVACVIAQRNNGGRTSPATTRTTIVRAPLNGELNRLRRIQSIGRAGTLCGWRDTRLRGTDIGFSAVAPLTGSPLSSAHLGHLPIGATRWL